MANKQQRIDFLRKSLVDQHYDMNVYNFLSFIDAAEIIFKYLEQEFRSKIGLDRTKILILDLLIVNGGSLIPSQLSWAVNRTKITITAALDYLEKHGLISSSKVKRDRRLRVVKITSKGLDLLDKFLPLRREIFAQTMSCFNQEEVEAFHSMINRFRENILCVTDGSELGDIINHYENYGFLNKITQEMR